MLSNKLTKGYEKHANQLTVPRSIIVLKNCVKHRVPSDLIAKMHFNDLYLLIMSLDIQDLENAINNRRKQADAKKGYEVKDIDPAETYKFLKGGN